MANMLKIQVRHGTPGIFQILEQLLQGFVNDAGFSGGKFTPFDLGVATVAAKELVHQLEHQTRIHDEQRRPAQGVHLDQAHAGGYVKGMDIVAVFHHLDTTNGHIGSTAQQVEQTDAGVTGKTLVDHFERRHPATYDTLVAGQIVGSYAIGIGTIIVDRKSTRLNSSHVRISYAVFCLKKKKKKKKDKKLDHTQITAASIRA